MDLEELRLIRPKEFAHLLGISICQVYNLVKKGTIPPPIQQEDENISYWTYETVKETLIKRQTV